MAPGKTLYERGVRVVHRGYKLTLSPLIGQSCRFMPTCSDYAAQALIEHGPARGGWLTVKRLCKCHPFGKSGYDPVPTSETVSARPKSGTRSTKKQKTEP